MKKFLVMALAGAVAIGAGLPASATSLIKLDLNAMVDQSTMVVVGKVMEQRYADTADGFYTMTTLAVSDTVLGDSETAVTVSVPGGIKMSGKFKLAETWAGAPRFIKGQEVLLFLSGADASEAQVVGFSQGVFNVVETAQGKSVLMPGGSGKMVSLNDAKARIRSAADAHGHTGDVTSD